MRSVGFIGATGDPSGLPGTDRLRQSPCSAKQAPRPRRSGRPGRSMRSGRRARVRASAWARRQRATRPWSPERSTSGTSHPRNAAGRVYCGYSSRPSAEGLLVGRGLVAHHPRHQPADRLEHHHRRHLAAGQHVVADRELAVDEVLVHPLVDALVAAAQQGEAVAGRELARPGPGRGAGRRGRAAAAGGAGRPPRPPRTAARASAPCPLRRRTGRRRPSGATSVVWPRRSCTRTSSRPLVPGLAEEARPAKSSTIDGKIVKTSMRMAPRACHGDRCRLRTRAR